jgi:general secretion pathway protein L
MTKTAAAEKIISFAAPAAAMLRKGWNAIYKILRFSPADNIIYPAKCICLSIDKGSIFIAYGTRIIGKVKIKKNTRYNLPHGEFPKPAEVSASVSETIRQWGISKTDIAINLPKALVIIKDQEFPAAARENIGNVISYELDRITPLSANDAYYDFTIISEDDKSIKVNVMAVKKSAVNPYIEALKESGITVSSIFSHSSNLNSGSAVAMDSAAQAVIQYLSAAGEKTDLLTMGMKQTEKMPLGFTLLISFAILTLITIYLASPIYIESKKLQQIEAQIKSKKGDLKAVEALKKDVETLNNELMTIEGFKQNSPDAIEMIKELTAIIPKNTWLSRVRITPTTVEIEGYAETTSGLLTTLENSRHFSKAEFASPTYKDMSFKADRFVIKMLIEGAQKDKEQKK